MRLEGMPPLLAVDRWVPLFGGSLTFGRMFFSGIKRLDLGQMPENGSDSDDENVRPDSSR